MVCGSCPMIRKGRRFECLMGNHCDSELPMSPKTVCDSQHEGDKCLVGHRLSGECLVKYFGLQQTLFALFMTSHLTRPRCSLVALCTSAD